MIESNNKKTFICINFYTADKKLCEYEKFLGEKTGTVPAKPGSWNVCLRIH